MAFALVGAILVATAVGLITYQLATRQATLKTDSVKQQLSGAITALSTAKADFEARQEELRRSIEEARRREQEAKTTAKECEARSRDIAVELNRALEEKGRFHNEATRVEEARAVILERDTQLQLAQSRIEELEREKTVALKDAEAANRRAIEMVAIEREAQAESLRWTPDTMTTTRLQSLRT